MLDQKKRGGNMKNTIINIFIMFFYTIFIIFLFLSPHFLFTGCSTKTIIIDDVDTRDLTGKILYDENGRTYSPRYKGNNLFCIDDVYNNKIIYRNEFNLEN